MEKIVSIKEVTFCGRDEQSNSDGYEIETTKQTIRMGIENEQACSETWGYFWRNDDIEDFIGAELLDVKLVDGELNEVEMTKEKLDEIDLPNTFTGGLMFVNLYTSKGPLQFVVYNAHNGYYGHDAFVESVQLTVKDTL